MTERMNKICHPELGCSGNLNPSETVHSLNVGDLHSDSNGAAAPDVECKSRSDHSSRNEVRPCTGRRVAVSREIPNEVGLTFIARKQRDLAQEIKLETYLMHLYPNLWREDWMTQALWNVLRNTGSRTAGVDGKVKANYCNSEGLTTYGKEQIEITCQSLKEQTYKTQPSLRILIPKANGKERPIGIPTINDRMVQEAIRMVLEPIYEGTFLGCSHGFRPNRCTMDAIQVCYQHVNSIQKYYWVIEGDIKGCFDNINHKILIKLIRKTIADRKLTSLIRSFLRAGYVENGMKRTPETGTPQGGIISPLLANIYLHEMDMWWAENLHGDTVKIMRTRRREGLGNFLLSRYADDFIILSNATRRIVEETKELLAEFLQTELKLELSKEKTIVKHVTKGFEFLGFHVRLYKGMNTVLIYPTKRNTQRMRDKIDTVLNRKHYNASVIDVIRILNPIVRGWANYYQYVNSFKTLHNLDYYLIMKFYKWYRGKYRMGLRKGTIRAKKWTDGTQPFRLRRFGDTKVERRTWQKDYRENPYIRMKMGIIQENPFPEIRWYGKKIRSTDLKLECFKRDKYICQICKKPKERLIAHHKIPIYLGGADVLSNLVTICENCEKKCYKILHHSRTGWQELMGFMERADATNGEPCAVKVASTVRRRGG